MKMSLIYEIRKSPVAKEKPDGAVEIGSSSFFAVPLPYLRFCSPLPDFYKRFIQLSQLYKPP